MAAFLPTLAVVLLLALLPDHLVRLAVLLALMGAAIEVLQGITGRDMSVFDWFADCLGMAYGLRTMSWVKGFLANQL
ncbi:hypothetical protein NKI56_30080 [Mesorhizobium sp. M0622]|uniref:hypothetical protein n=1 Tax=unclassified Mesorhizobium TaxID=325217 RepID=UPI003339E0D7